MIQEIMNIAPSSFAERLTHVIDNSVIDIFIQKTVEYPENKAIITAERTVSYRELAQQAQSLAVYLRQQGVKYESPVAILLEPGIEQIICQVAILLAGGSCVPLDPAMPDERLGFMLQDLQVNLTLTDIKSQERPLPTNFITMNESLLKPTDAVHLLDIHSGKTHRTHILFTSGTTGKPKAVGIEAQGILRFVVNTNYINFVATDKIACIANPTFDASLFEIWGALLNGATIVIIPRKTVIDPYLFEAALKRFSVNTMFITTTLFNLVASTCPWAFRGLRYLLVGGEALNPYSLRQVLQSSPPQHLINGYGPTESTIFATTHEITLDQLTGESIPIGKPINNTEVYILDDQQQFVAPSQLGGIYIGGTGLARGYWNRPEINAQRFIVADVNKNNTLRRAYNTGDLGWQRSDGVFMYAGRADNQIKLRGHRIEIEKIEAQLLESQFLKSAAVCVIKKENIEPYLTGFIVPKDPDSFSKQELIQWINTRLPNYMLPQLVVIGHIPVTHNGKIDRARLLEECLENQEQQLLPQSSTQMSEEESAILNIWQQVLDSYDLTLDSDFFQSGGSSLQAARLVVEIRRKMQRSLSVQNLYDAPTPRKLVESLQQNHQEDIDICTVMLKDGVLPLDIQPLSQPLQPWLTPNTGRILLTGATGFLGAFFLRDLLLQPEINQVTCLVRAHDNDAALLRVKKNLNQYGVWQDEFLPRLQVIAGDITEPLLAMNPQTYKRLSVECDVIFHLAAHVNYIQPYSAHRAGNVVGTLNLLRFAVSEKVKSFHYISTIAVFGPAGLLSPISTIYEDDDIMPYLDAMRYDSGYSQSKWVVERIIWQARDRGIPLSVYRPGFIMGDSQTGAGNPNDSIARLLKGCIEIGAYPLLVNQRREFVPVNYVSSALLNISRDNNRLGRAYHLVTPDNKHSVDFNQFFELLKQCGYQLNGLDYSEWLEKLEADPALVDNPLMPLIPILSENIYGQLTRWEVYENMPAYDAKNTNIALKRTHKLYAPMDSHLLERYLSYWRRIGFLS
ncbi:non-ribosomal peptide synthetase [Xenorhabdus bovienii]|uniref:non-ribosomal peptide synthetase n=1 Tax=Xenorhabdus bovienii TaxID=40576 RepID=UPI0021578AB7|nr:non-ribosomal peptide synthetase [Xenorhabdus bovienii]